MNDTPEADDTVAYWNPTHDRPGCGTSNPPAPGHRPRLRVRPRPVRREPAQVRSGAEALGAARQFLDAALMFGFGIVCPVAAGYGGDRAFLVVLIGLVAIGCSGYIAFFATSYTMPYFIYALAVVGGIWLLFG